MENVKTACQHSEARPDRRERSSVHLQPVFLHREGPGSKFRIFNFQIFYFKFWISKRFFELFVVQLIHRKLIHERVENKVNSLKTNPEKAWNNSVQK